MVPWNTHHVVDVLPEVEGDELEGGEHGPQEVVEARVAKVGVVPDVGKAHVALRTAPATWDLKDAPLPNFIRT